MAFHLTEQQLAALHPGVHRPRQWLDTLNDAMARFRIDTPPRAAAFLAQVLYARIAG
jgi:predicted chitinase